MRKTDARCAPAAALLAGILLACPFGPAASAADRTFTSPFVVIPSWAPPGPFSLADFNGDGRPDLVTSGGSGDCAPACGSDYETVISAALSPPAGGFPSGAGPIWSHDGGALFAAADFNLDGRDDLIVVTGYGSRIDVLLTRTDRMAFDLRATYPGGDVEGARVLTGDFNGDRWPDFVLPSHYVLLPPYLGGVSEFLGNGDGTFTRRELSTPSDHLVASGDLDGDARLDLLFYLPGKVAALMGAGDGTFLPGPVTANGALGAWSQLADFNGDRVLDLLVDGGVLPGRGDGSFGAKIVHGVPGACSIGDFNGDGRPDLAVSGPRLVVMLGRGDGSFAVPTSYESGGGYGLAAADFDGDGHVDLATGAVGARTTHELGWIYILPGHGDGTFGDGGDHPVPEGPVALGIADLNRDGHPDVAVASREARSVTVLFGSPSGRLAPAGGFATADRPNSIVFEDLTLDGIPDLAVLQPPRLSVHPGRRDGSFLPPVHYPTDPSAGSLTAGDFDEDGRPDLAVVNFYPETISLFLAGADGFRAGVDVAGPRSPQHLSVADYTGDGHLDLAVVGALSITLLRGSGDGRFEQTGMDDPPYGWEEEGFSAAAAYDRHGECRPVIAAAWRGCSYDRPGMDCNYAAVFMKLGSRGTLEWTGRAGAGVPLTAIAAGDLTGDGQADLAATFFPGGVSVDIASGESGFQSGLLLGTGSAPTAIAIEDMNGDGRLDIVTANGGSGTVTVLTNLGDRPTIPPSPRGVAARAGEAEIAVSWDPVTHPDLSAYRVYYGRADAGPVPAGTEAAEGPSPVTVPASRTDITLHCLPDSAYALRVTAVDRDGRESRCAPAITSRPLPAGGRLRVTPRELGTASHGRWITATIDLSPGFAAEDAIAGTTRLNGIAAEGRGVEGGRSHGSSLTLKFPRAEVAATLASGAGVLTAEGLVLGCADTVRFVARDTLESVSGHRVASRGGGATPAVPGSSSPDFPADGSARAAVGLYTLTPNPARSACEIGFELPGSAHTRLQVFDVSGRLVGSLLDGVVPAGRHAARWEARGLADGLYFVRLQAGGRSSTIRVVLAR